jgi:uncharacterized membrane protein YjgN (DUF898 family)|tara:strand:+ start:407 stop:1408 length:1002 start_codon:yes stop_codon:yes gene_type:complete
MEQSSDMVVHKVDFRGDGSEYFRIWIVNVLLTIVTLGIYSAWATVRNNRYFYSNFYLGDSHFEYLADPITILKGRMVAIVVLVIYAVVSVLYPLAGLIFTLALIILFPYLIVRSLVFGRRMTSFRNIQFRFKGTYGGALMAFIIWPILGVLSLGLLFPLSLVKRNAFVIKNSAYGTTAFEFTATYKDYFLIILASFGLVLLAIIGSVMLSFVLPPIMAGFVIVLGIYATGFYAASRTHNLMFNTTFLNEHGFNSTVTAGGLFQVALINTLFIILTLGLYLPAAKVRSTKYVCSRLEFEAAGSLDDFVAAEKENASAIGEELGDALDLDIGLGI